MYNLKAQEPRENPDIHGFAYICFARKWTCSSFCGVPGMTFSSPCNGVSERAYKSVSICGRDEYTKLSNTHLFSGLSHFRHCHICWLLFSRHSQCFRNSCRQCLLTSASLEGISVPVQVYFSVRAPIHARGTSCDLPPLPQAVDLAPAIGFGLALHKVVVVGLAASTDEEGGTHQWSGAGTDFRDLRYVIGKGSGVDEDMLVESGGQC
jgi:hypothetical protein